MQFFFFFLWHKISETFAPTIPGGAQALYKEFPASAPRLIQGAIKFFRSNGHKEAVAGQFNNSLQLYYLVACLSEVC
jgi:hypothetical protein